MKRRILAVVASLVCAVTLVAAELAPAYASAPLGDEEGIVTYAEEVRWYYRVRDGVREMRLWSITYQRWLTDWVPVDP